MMPTNPLAQLAAADVDQQAMMRTMRNALLMQARWVEDHGAEVESPILRAYFGMLRRSSLEIVREIERQLAIKPKRRIVRRNGKRA